ncbi:MAG: hypothetical protein ACOCRK_00805 [bacterium]
MFNVVDEKDKLLLINVANEIIKETNADEIIEVNEIENLYCNFIDKEEVLSTLLSLSNDLYHKKNITDVLEKKESKEFVLYYVNNYNKKRGVNHVL